MADLTMNLNETLELDVLVEEWNDPNNIVEENNGFQMSGVSTKTKILNPTEAGTYDISVNGELWRL